MRGVGDLLAGFAGAAIGVLAAVGAVSVVAWLSTPAAHALVVIGIRG